MVPKTPPLTTDCVIYDPAGNVLLVRRRFDPFAGSYALPGGFVEIGETTEAACRREVKEETGIDAGDLTLVGVYSDPKRDPRGPTVTIVYATALAASVRPQAGDDAAAAEWITDWRSLKLAFDHAKILDDAEALGPGSGGARRPAG